MARPFFAAAWAASQQIYDPVNSGQRVATLVGGYVEKNINNSEPSQKWTSTCAVRMSYILNHAGFIIPKIPGQTVSGGDQRQYFFRVKNLITFLEAKWGKPDVVKYPPTGGGALAGKKGVILFEVSGWDDAQGHATLFDGNTCYDHCYFNEPGVNYHTDQANFWSLS
jgi:hypothetical protein